MRGAAIFVTLFMGISAFAHDEGHGPKSTGVKPNKGGIVSAVVMKKDQTKGRQAEGVYWAELYRDPEGNAHVYVYKKEPKRDVDGKERLEPLEMQKLEMKASAEMQAKVKGKWKKVSFDLEQKNGEFLGKMPKPEGKPYNIDVTLKESGTELFSAFDNLD